LKCSEASSDENFRFRSVPENLQDWRDLVPHVGSDFHHIPSPRTSQPNTGPNAEQLFVKERSKVIKERDGK
jgi:hypothetical protein